MQLCASFDTSYVHRKDLHFHNIETTDHYRRLEEDYKIIEDNGFTLFRDSAYLLYSFGKYDNHWAYLDRLAKISGGRIMLTISHYEMPFMPDSSISEVNRFTRFIEELASRYKGVFHSYLPVCESGFWAQKLTEDWLPHFNSWWDAWAHISEITALIATVIKKVDPSAKIAMAEPIYWRDMDDNCRPFDTLLGKYDPVAVKERCNSWALGDEALLDIIGLNIYNMPDIKALIWAINNRYADKEICITETNNNHSGMDFWKYYQSIGDQVDETALSLVFWNPIIQMNTFEDGLPIGGGYLFDQKRNKCY